MHRHVVMCGSDGSLLGDGRGSAHLVTSSTHKAKTNTSHFCFQKGAADILRLWKYPFERRVTNVLGFFQMPLGRGVANV